MQFSVTEKLLTPTNFPIGYGLGKGKGNLPGAIFHVPQLSKQDIAFNQIIKK